MLCYIPYKASPVPVGRFPVSSNKNICSLIKVGTLFNSVFTFLHNCARCQKCNDFHSVSYVRNTCCIAQAITSDFLFCPLDYRWWEQHWPRNRNVLWRHNSAPFGLTIQSDYSYVFLRRKWRESWIQTYLFR